MLATNYVICAHKDLDGFCCAAILSKYYPKAHVFFKSQGVNEIIFYELGNYLRKYTQNVFYICDLSLEKSSVKTINKILEKYRKEFDIKVIWIDHHPWDTSAIPKNIEFIGPEDSSNKSSACLVEQFLNFNASSIYVKIANGLRDKDAFYWKTVINKV